MRFVSIEELSAGNVLAKAVCSEDGTVLITSGMVLSPSLIARLRSWGYPGVYISDEGDQTTDSAQDPIDLETRDNAVSAVREVFSCLQKQQELPVVKLKQSVGTIVEQLAAKPRVAHNLQHVRSFDVYTFHHSVNVSVIAIFLGLRFDLTQDELSDLGVGAILHDLGKLEVPGNIIKKAGPLSSGEMVKVKDHPKFAWDLLRQHPDISLASAQVAYQHHEKLNGSGYPLGIKGREISWLAQIVAVADVFDAIVSHRVYKKAQAPLDAISFLRRWRGVLFNKDVVELLADNICV